MSKWRRTRNLVLTLALALMIVSGDALFSQGRVAGRRIVILDGREVVEGEVLVRYRAQAGRLERERAEFQAHSDASEPIGRLGTRRIRSRQQTTRQMLATLRANPDVEVVEPNYIIRATAAPNDASFASLWGLLNTGQTVDGQAGVAGADIAATPAWDITTGSRANVVAIIDTGIDWTHPDLAANVFSAPSQFSVQVGSNTITCAAGTHGFNALTNTCSPVDDNGHGTHVAGIIGAVGNNGVGVTGVNWVANLMAIKVLGVDGAGTTSDAIKGIEFAIKAKAALGANANIRVLNASWGGHNFSQLLSEQVQAANSADMLFVAAAGTDGGNNDVTPHYPASYGGANVLSVTAVDNTGEWGSFANYGATSVHLAAPGAAVLSTFPDNTYGELSGTSMAAPHVSGAAALVLARCPMNTATLKSVLLSTVTPVGSLSGRTSSGGRLNAHAALQECQSHLPRVDVGTTMVDPGATVNFQVANGPANPSDWVAFYRTADGDHTYTQWSYLNGSTTPPSSGVSNASLQFTAPLTAGTYNIRLFSNGGYTKLATSATITVASRPTLTINDVSVNEGNSGTANATFTVTVSPVNDSQTVTVNYATANGSAAAGSDYTSASGTLTFAPSVATQTITVPVVGDTALESNETFVVNLSSAINAVIVDAQGTGTIVNDDASSASITLQSTWVAQGGTIAFQVVNGPANPRDWVAFYPTGAADSGFQQWSYLNGSSTPPSSGIANASLQFVAPQTAGTYQIRLFADNSYSRLATSATITVGGTPPPQPRLTINDVSVTEGNSGTVNATFTVTLSPVNSSQTVTVAYATANGSATTANNDYSATSGTLSFAASVATQTITVPVIGDTNAESTEQFVVNLTNATNATIGDAQGVGTITNDDAAGTAAVTLQSTSVAPGGTVHFQVVNGPANPRDWVAFFPASGDDYTFTQWTYLNGSSTAPSSGIANASLYFIAPQTAGTYNIRLFADNSYTKLATSATLTVGGQAAPQPSITINDVSVTEGHSGTVNATFTVTVSPVNSSQTVTVNFATANGSATAGSDYTAGSGTVTFAPSVATQQITVPVIGDTSAEGNETFVVNLSGAANATIGDAQGTATIVNDDSAGTPTITLSSSSVSPGAAIQFQIADGPANAKDWVALFPASGDDYSFTQWSYLNGSQTAPASGTSSASLQFTAPQTPGTYNIRLFANNSYSKLATSATITVGTQSAAQPTLTINDISITEGNSGTPTATFTVTLAPANTSQTVTVNFATANGTATVANNDYAAASGTLTFPPSVTTRTITVPIVGDTTVEANETFVVNLSGATNASIGDAQGTGTIVNDDASGAAITVQTTSVPRGGTISFQVVNGPANARDWVAFFPSSGDDYSFSQWSYLNGSSTPPASGTANASLQFVAPQTAGTYNIRLFADNSYSKIATSVTITVTP